MSTAGQAAGYVIGGVVGAMFPAVGWVIGAQIGGMIGGYIDPPKGQNTVGPRLEDLTVQTSTYGSIVPRIKGTVSVTGNVFWLEGDQIKEHEKTKKVGGKGGPTAKQTTYSYSATFAVSLAHCTTAPIAGIRRLWLANTLVYDAGSDNLQSIIASNLQAGVVFKVYDGRDNQSPDPRLQADKGVANVSGYPGRAYIVFYDLDLTEHYSNTLMATQAKVELVTVGSPGVDVDQAEIIIGGLSTERNPVSCVFNGAGADYTQVDRDGWTVLPENIDYCTLRLSDYHTISGSYDMTGDVAAGFSTYSFFHVKAASSDRRVAIMQLVPPSPFNTESRIWFYSQSENWKSHVLPGASFDITLEKFASVEGNETFIHCGSSGGHVYKFLGSVLTITSSGTYSARASGLSENFLFLVSYAASSATTTIYRLNRSDLSLNATWTGAYSSSNAAIYVLDDETVYTAVNEHVYKWISGAMVDDLGAVVPPTFASDTTTLSGWFKVLSDEPPYVLSLSNHRDTNYAVQVGHPLLAQTPSKLHDVIIDECALVGISSGDIDLTELTNHDVRGYRNTGSPRTALEQLQAAFPFDVLQSGYKIKFKDRGGSSVLTVPESDLGAHTGSDMPVRFSTLLEMPTQVPAKVTFNFLNADREYDPDEQSSAYTAQEVKNSYTVSLPLVMTPTEAKRAADVLLKKEQVERTKVAPFWLPPTDNYRKLEAADVVDVIAQGRTHTVRLTKVSNLPDGRVECEGRLTASAAYTSTAEAQDSLVFGQSLVPLAGSTEAIILDIPRIVSAQDVPGVSAAMFGYTADWPGGVLFRSDDSGQTYGSVTSFLSKTEIFTASDMLASRPPYAIDHVSTLTVTPDFSGADLFSITETQLYAHGNLAAYGSDGRWEIVAFKTVIDNTGSYALRDWLRGLYGTEQYSGTHVVGDRLVMLDLDNADFVGLPLTAINSPRLWRGVTSGASIDSATDITHTYAVANLKPLSPVEMRGWRDQTTKDWTLVASHRTRTPVELFSGLAQPIGETSEAYELELWDSGFTILKRTFAGLTTPEVQYTEAQQISDFGIEQSTLYYKLYQLSSVIGRGYPLSGSITRTIAADPYGEFVVLLLHMDDTGLSDVKGHTTTIGASAARSATQSKFGGYSAYFPGGGYLDYGSSADFDIFGGDFTLEFQLDLNSATANQAIFSLWKDNSNYVNIGLLSGNIYYYSQLPADGAIRISAAAPTAASWAYVVFKKSGTTISLEINGTSVGTTTSGTYPTGNLALRIGAYAADGTIPFTGYVDEVRLTKGVARTTSTQPTAAFPNP